MRVMMSHRQWAGRGAPRLPVLVWKEEELFFRSMLRVGVAFVLPTAPCVASQGGGASDYAQRRARRRAGERQTPRIGGRQAVGSVCSSCFAVLSPVRRPAAPAGMRRGR